MKAIKYALVTAALACSTMVMAQSKAALIQQFLDLQSPGIDSIARGLVQQSSDPIALAGGQYLNTEVPQDKRATLGAAADAQLKRYFDDVYPMVRDTAQKEAPTVLTPVLEQSFTEDELRQLNAWVSSPLSKKYQDVTLQMQQVLIERVVADTRTTVEPKLKVLEEDVAKALGAPIGGAAAAPAASRPAPSRPAASANRKK
ncbi:MAG: DUF2059 domain-containing protein [Variovorax sp.]